MLYYRKINIFYESFAFFNFFSMNQQYIEEIKSIEKCKQNLKKLAKPVFGFLSEEQSEAVDPIKSKLDSLGEQIFRWVIMIRWGSANLSPVIVYIHFSR